MLFTDPPYGFKYQSNSRTATKKFDVLKNDDKIIDFFETAKQFFDGWAYVCASWKTFAEWQRIFEQYYKLTNVVIWDKGGGGIGDLEKTFSTDYEMILVSNSGKQFEGKRCGSVWRFQKDAPSLYLHPTQKPVSLPAFAIQKSTKPNDIVLDVFGGSGSTLIAAEQTGRRCYMSELEPKYCDVIIQRWENLTGQKAELISE